MRLNNDPRTLCTISVALLLAGALALPGATASDPELMPDERPDDWTRDESGHLVCARANAGANVGCSVSGGHVATCEYTYGQIMGG